MLGNIIIIIINFLDKHIKIRNFLYNNKEKIQPLAGDRAIEWSWIVKYLPTITSHVLDVGCVNSPLTCIVSRLKHNVTSVDLNEIEYTMDNINFQKGDIINIDLNSAFDIIINCSTIEHVGLKGRYASIEKQDGDIIVMNKLYNLLNNNGKMILTIPVGIDNIIAPYHRIYGSKRLPLLLNKYDIICEEYWCKNFFNKWNICSKQEALKTHGSYNYYSLGLFYLKKKSIENA